ncbi:Z1 domain-containing protein [Bradyrhizobium yuanmingense]|uniref:Z1 domain-containing protein n=1 Tax=Bradyrhizobium yuanmingense TaxID=108015 RepID=UPI0035119DD9
MDLKQLPRPSGDRIQQVAAEILGKGMNPRATDGQRTGLVVGYVQSGKTLSFTTVIALARDNGIPVVIVVAGTAENLFNQTIERLLEDLQVNSFDGPPRWLHLRNPGVGNRQTIQNAINRWRNPNLPAAEKGTLLITVMKQHQRLGQLNEVLGQLNLAGVPALLIDDEADQASLNTRVRTGQESTTYTRLIQLREILPHLTYLQYTATPQAPLLINIADVLSPEFTQVLDVGPDYVGGSDFFGQNQQYTRVIPQDEVPSRDNPIIDPPNTLLEALQIFFIGVSAGRIQGWDRDNPNRSMLVHPSRTTLEHFQYFQSIQTVKDQWAAILALPDADPDKQELVQDFARAHANLAATVGPQLPAFAAILNRLADDITETQVREINRRSGNRAREMNWRQEYAWILVGGQAMDRGFTVKELTVTYMPRGIGTGNADTLQQRARFFGYKRRYLGYCRIYLEAAALDAFQGYVRHEEQMREELTGVQQRGESLANWKRRFVLDDDLRPCRANVIDQELVRGNYADDWFFARMVRMSDAALTANKAVIESFTRPLRFTLDRTYDQPAQQHESVNGVPLQQVLSELILNYRLEDPSDTENSLGMLLQLSQALRDNPDETTSIFRMRPAYRGSRGIDANGRIASIRRLQQGPTRSGGGYSYPGDFDFKDNDRVTVQLHTIDLTEGEGANRRTVAEAVPAIAIWIPRRMSQGWVVQEQRDED